MTDDSPFAVEITGGNVKGSVTGATPSNRAVTVYQASFAEPSDATGKAFAITTPTGYNLIGSTAIEGRWYVYLPTGTAWASYDSKPYIATVTTDNAATFTLPPKKGLVDKTTNIKVEYADGSPFESDIVLRVTSKSQAEMDQFKDNVEKAAPGLVLGGLYDVKLFKDGVAFTLNDKVKVSIPLTDKLKAMTDLKVGYIADNGNVTIIDSEVKDGVIIVPAPDGCFRNGSFHPLQEEARMQAS